MAIHKSLRENIHAEFYTVLGGHTRSDLSVGLERQVSHVSI